MNKDKKEASKNEMKKSESKSNPSAAALKAIKDRDESFSDSKHPRKHDAPKTSRNPKGFS
ncbi:hypothetical protein H8S90_21050 [Olivibacter sp. SDN3]|uniref:hypothetical protein n=1 Tax=Olivibacter sp. SDN3 TaxID=2764720 RepID=UPI001650F232|nr:hypothetical protein [Olivibacter sp. SDN3]QNL49200.1 hypothetical protein H8S90_21050 [Olivibacter sp. SDN3]